VHVKHHFFLFCCLYYSMFFSCRWMTMFFFVL
jgi:hypothetical protein